RLEKATRGAPTPVVPGDFGARRPYPQIDREGCSRPPLHAQANAGDRREDQGDATADSCAGKTAHGDRDPAPRLIAAGGAFSGWGRDTSPRLTMVARRQPRASQATRMFALPRFG